MRILKPFSRIAAVLLIGSAGIAVRADEPTVARDKVTQEASARRDTTTGLRVVDRAAPAPVLTVAKHGDDVTQTETRPAPVPVVAPAPAVAAAMKPVAESSAKPERSLRIATANTRPTVVAIDSTERLEIVTDRYPGGRVRLERQVTLDAKGNYVNEGYYTQYDHDGQLIKAGQFHAGKQTGRWTQRVNTTDGSLLSLTQETEFQAPFVSEASFQQGTLDGGWTVKDANGQTLISWNFEHGVRSGTWTWWHGNGNKQLEATYVGGQLQGEVKEWDRDGQLTNCDEYLEGRRLAKSVGWYTLGQKQFEGRYLRGAVMAEAKYDWWNSRTVASKAAPANTDQQHGQWTTWFANGRTRLEAHYDHGVRVGQFKWYFDNGQLQAQGSFDVAGKRTGTWTTWHANGVKESVAEYHGDRLVGQLAHWDTDGRRLDAPKAATGPVAATKETAKDSAQETSVVAPAM